MVAHSINTVPTSEINQLLWLIHCITKPELSTKRLSAPLICIGRLKWLSTFAYQIRWKTTFNPEHHKKSQKRKCCIKICVFFCLVEMEQIHALWSKKQEKHLPHTLLPFCKFVSSQLDASDRPNALKKENIFMIPSCGEKQGGNPEQLPH